ncbi:MAG: DegT/DnrJ/EryC1/StrS family aminotransferase [Treponemataceae bacterium]|nr:DegT/DnrJ/EryC1/StrS family aminotransferase [Treponemataceae bacterium]
MSQNDSPVSIPFFKPSIGKEEEEAVIKVLHSGWLSTAKESLAFEKEFSEFIKCRNCLAVNSNTSGLLLAMEACGIKAGTKILTTPYTFISTATSALHLGGEVLYADIEEDSYSISPESIEKKLKEDSSIKAVVPVHIGGNVCDMKAINELASKYKVKVIEDAAHAFPALTKEGYAGTLGDIGVFSFYATKTITTGEGGMIATNDDELAHRMTVMRLHGIDRSVWDRYTSSKTSWEYDVIEPGFKCNLPDILAALGRVQLKKANLFLEKRKKLFKKYNELFKDCDFLELPPDDEGNSYHLYLIRIVPEKLRISRNELSNMLQAKGIGISMHFIPHFHMTYMKNLYGLKPEMFPHAQKQYERTLTLPLWPDMPEDMVEYTAETIILICKENYVR